MARGKQTGASTPTQSGRTTRRADRGRGSRSAGDDLAAGVRVAEPAVVAALLALTERMASVHSAHLALHALAAAFQNVPGVADASPEVEDSFGKTVKLCVSDVAEGRRPLTSETDAGLSPGPNPDNHSRIVELRTSRRLLGSVQLELHSPEAFAPYVAIVRHVADLAAVVLERNLALARLDDASLELNDVRRELHSQRTEHRADRQRADAQLQREIEERTLATAAWRASEERYQRLFRTISDAVIILDVDTGQILDVNAAAEHLYGFNRTELLALRIDDLSAEPEVTRQSILQTCRKTVNRVPIRHHRRSDGTIIPVEITANAFMLGNREVVCGIARDISARLDAERQVRDLEAQLHQAQKMEAIGRLAGGIAHDFNNLLAVMLGYAEIMSVACADDDPRRASLEEIVGAGRRAAALTRQLLAFSRKQVLAPKLLSANTAVSNISGLLSRLLGEDVKLACKLPDDVGTVYVDPGQLDQVLMNLAVNARDAMPQGGKLIIETANRDFAEGAADGPHGIPAGAYVMLSVSDTGTGMTDEVRARLFEPFFTTKEKDKGTGLGLATVYGIVTQSGGFLDVHTKLGRGSTFLVYLPRLPTHELADTDTCERPSIALQAAGQWVLVVEDRQDLLKLTAEILIRSGYQVLTARSAQQAIASSERHPGEIHLLLVDVVLPDVSGPKLVARIQRRRPTAQVLYMSGYTDDTIARHGLGGDDEALLGKPFTPRELRRAVRRALAVRS